MDEVNEQPIENILWWRQRKRNGPQERSMIPGTLLMINTGMQIAWSLFNNHFQQQLWATQSNQIEILIVQCSWFVGAIVGGFNAGYFIDTLGRRKLLRVSIAAHLISGLILIFFSRSVIGLMFGRVIGGYGSGVVYITQIIYAGEISMNYNRGIITAFTHLGTIIGIFIFTIINPLAIIYEELDLAFIIGITMGSLAVIALPFNIWIMVESPIYLIQQNLESDAVEAILRLNGERVVTEDVRQHFYGIQQMVAAERRIDKSIFKIRSFYFIIILKCLLLMVTFNYILNLTRLNIIENSIHGSDYKMQSLILSSIRVLGGIITLIIVDVIGRVPIFLWTIRLSAISILFLAIGFAASETIMQNIFNIAFEICSSFGLSMIIDIYSTELLPTFKRGIGLSLIFAMENLIHMILLIIGFTIGANTILSCVILFLSASILIFGSFLQLPETKQQAIFVVKHIFKGIKLGLQIW